MAPRLSSRVSCAFCLPRPHFIGSNNRNCVLLHLFFQILIFSSYSSCFSIAAVMFVLLTTLYFRDTCIVLESESTIIL
jgi:hypothetical protein